MSCSLIRSSTLCEIISTVLAQSTAWIPRGSKVKLFSCISVYLQATSNLQWRNLNQCEVARLRWHVPLTSPFLWPAPLIFLKDTLMDKMGMQPILPSNCLPLLTQCSTLTVTLRDTVTLRVNRPWDTGFPTLLTKQVHVDHVRDERSKVRSWSFQPLYSCNN